MLFCSLGIFIRHIIINIIYLFLILKSTIIPIFRELSKMILDTKAHLFQGNKPDVNVSFLVVYGFWLP